MIKSILFKEWIKTRWIILIIMVVFLAVGGYTFLNISRGLRMAGGQHIWEMIVQKGITFVDFNKYVPLFAGIILALSQYIPEMTNKRLKLTLHLPMRESTILLSMLFFGLILLFAIFVADYLLLYIGLNMSFPTEVACWNITKTIPWFIGGLMAYLLTCWICIEPVWRQRILNGVIAIPTIWLYYFDETSAAYNPFIWCLILLTLAGVSYSFYSLIRFKDGELF